MLLAQMNCTALISVDGGLIQEIRQQDETLNVPYRRKAEGRRQEAGGRKYNFCPLLKGFKAPKFIYEKKKKYVFRDAQRKKYYVPIESPKFIYGVSLLPSAFCLLPSQIPLKIMFKVENWAEYWPTGSPH